MEGVVNGLLLPPQKPLTREFDDNGVPHPSSKVDYCLNNLIASYLHNSDLTPQEVAEASRSSAEAASLAAKVARAKAYEKAAAAAKAVAAAKIALDLVASFPNQTTKHVATDSSCSDDEELPSELQPEEDSEGITPNRHDQCKARILSVDCPNRERVDSNGLGMELDSNRPNESAGRRGAKEGTQVTRKRGRPKSK